MLLLLTLLLAFMVCDLSSYNSIPLNSIDKEMASLLYLSLLPFIVERQCNCLCVIIIIVCCRGVREILFKIEIALIKEA